MRSVGLGVCFMLLSGLGSDRPASAQVGAWARSGDSRCLVWDPEPRPDRFARWSGACVDGRATGHGTLEWSRNGRSSGRYVGEMQDGRLHGRGVYLAPGGSRDEGLYYRGRFVVRGSREQGILMRAAQVPTDPQARADDGSCAVEILASSIVPQDISLAGLIEIRRNGEWLANMKFNLNHLAPNEFRTESFGYFGCRKHAGPEDRYTFRLWEISICDMGGQLRGDCERLIGFEGDDRNLEDSRATRQ